MKKKRKIEILVLSDVHLGTYGCKAKELVNYLKSITPGHVILNGDFIDIWQFKKRYWPKAHTKVLNQIIKWMSKGITVDYITGNHDELLRRYVGFKMGTFSIVNKKVLKLGGKKAWFFHGDVFDVTMQFSPWLARFGAVGYDLLILLNNAINRISMSLGRGRLSFSKRVKDNVKSAIKFINQFEKTAIEIAAQNNYNFVVCGHIHKPEIKSYDTHIGEVTYLNSGDWIENLSALEYNKGIWTIYQYNENDFQHDTLNTDSATDLSEMSIKDIFGNLVEDIINNK
jgi:UDP-2,3-diacylglucosamine pyrophosphatase LpxH